VLDEVLGYLRNGATLVVWRLDRLGRSLRDLIEAVAALAERGIGFKSLTEQIDMTTPGGKLIFHVFGTPAEFAHERIREGTHAVLASARARGRCRKVRERGPERHAAIPAIPVTRRHGGRPLPDVP
jgi:DNA invertase Pin-like site-specific DNA recombinase